MDMSRNKYYAIVNGRTQGVFDTWEKCRRKVEGYKGAEFKGFPTLTDAIEYLEDGGNPNRGGVLNIGKRDVFYKTLAELCKALRNIEANE